MTKMAAIILASAVVALATPAAAERIKDLGGFAGIRSNQLIGYGIVVGLNGTGDDNLAYTIQSMKTALARFGAAIPPRVQAHLSNAAEVMRTPPRPPFVNHRQKHTLTTPTP